MAQQDRETRMPEDQRGHAATGSEATGRPAEEQSAGRQGPAGATHGDSAVGRENPAAGTADADEALGNRTGGYGRGPEEETGPPDAD